VPLVAVVLVAIELVMTGRLGTFWWVDVAISAALSAVSIQIAARIAERIVAVCLLYLLCFIAAWYVLTFVALPGTEELRTGGTTLATDGALTAAGHFHFLLRPFLFGVFTLLMSLMTVWGLLGSGRSEPK
jgi:hypothetical protein